MQAGTKLCTPLNDPCHRTPSVLLESDECNSVYTPDTCANGNSAPAKEARQLYGRLPLTASISIGCKEECSGSSPEAQSIHSKDDKLAEAKANARGVAGLLDGLGGLHQLLLVQLADLGLQGEGCNSADAGHCLCCCLVGLVKQLASLHMHVQHPKQTQVRAMTHAGRASHPSLCVGL